MPSSSKVPSSAVGLSWISILKGPSQQPLVSSSPNVTTAPPSDSIKGTPSPSKNIARVLKFDVDNEIKF